MHQRKQNFVLAEKNRPFSFSFCVLLSERVEAIRLNFEPVGYTTNPKSFLDLYQEKLSISPPKILIANYSYYVSEPSETLI